MGMGHGDGEEFDKKRDTRCVHIAGQLTNFVGLLLVLMDDVLTGLNNAPMQLQGTCLSEWDAIHTNAA
jgi:hypothetical protein